MDVAWEELEQQLQDSGGWQDGADRLDPVALAAKLAATREKNRIAQQRFRERQRQKQRQVDQRVSALQQELDEAAAEKERLQRQSLVHAKVLAVRDAILQTYTSLRPGSKQAQQVEQQMAAGVYAPAPVAVLGLARALEQLPSEQELDEASLEAQLQQQQPATPSGSAPGPATASEAGSAQQGNPAEQRAAASGMDSIASSTNLDGAGAPAFRLGQQHRSGTASQLDGSALRQVESIPPASDEAVVAQVEAMSEPDLVAYFRQWQVELAACYGASKAAGFDDASVAAVEALTERMVTVWWHVGQLKPDYLCYLAHIMLPENSGQLSLWREIAGEVMLQMDERGMGVVRRSWHNYSKRMAKIAVGVSRWVRKLQEYALQPSGGLVTNANNALELLDIANHMAAAVQEEYIASMEFVAAQFPASSTLLKAFVNIRSAPYLPDLVAIVYQMLQLDNERRQVRGPGAASQPLQVVQDIREQLASHAAQ